MISDKSKALMTRVLKLAEVNLTKNKIPIAALVASKDGNRIICEAVNNDSPLEHAEFIALSDAMRLLNKKRLNDYVLFTNLEPCPMCAGALIQARMGRIIYATEDPKRGALGGTINLAKHKSAHHNLLIEKGVMEEESRKLIVDWFKEKRVLSKGSLLSKLR